MSIVSKGPQLFKFGDMSNKIGDDNCSGLYLLKLNGSGKTNTGATAVREVGFRIRLSFLKYPSNTHPLPLHGTHN